MARGTLTTIETLSHTLLQRWVPKWYEAFADPVTGGFYERLGAGFKPVMTGQRRLLTQCRQLSLYSHARVQGIGRDLPGLEARFDNIVRSYHVPDGGGWLYSVDDSGAVRDGTFDLYSLAFVIFGCAQYYQATGEERARDLASATLGFIDSDFRSAGMPGFHEALNEKRRPIPGRPRRHETHMHLLEACLFAAETFHEPPYGKMADELVDLFLTYFFDPHARVLSEYYDDALRPQARDGRIVAEPGHYCEWIWLLKKQAAATGKPDRYDHVCRQLLSWAADHGWDDQYGGIFDELEPSGAIIADTKRIWPLAESLKANALMLDSGIDKQAAKDRIRKMVRVFRDHYMDERGFWTEWLRRDLSRETDYMPGTTPYHVYFGIMEARDVLRARGPTKSLAARPQIALYILRRRLSEAFRALRLYLKE